jgi:hypothetical protein
VERTLQNPDLSYESWGKLAAEGVTAEGNTIFVYYVESGPGEALVLSVKRRRGTPEGLIDCCSYGVVREAGGGAAAVIWRRMFGV